MRGVYKILVEQLRQAAVEVGKDKTSLEMLEKREAYYGCLRLCCLELLVVACALKGHSQYDLRNSSHCVSGQSASFGLTVAHMPLPDWNSQGNLALPPLSCQARPRLFRRFDHIFRRSTGLFSCQEALARMIYLS